LTQKQKAYLALACISIVWGYTWTVSRDAILFGGFSPIQLTSIRQLLGGAIFVGFFLIKGFKFPSVKELPILLILSFLMFTCSNGLSTLGVRTIGSGLGSIIGATSSLWLVIFGYFILKQKISYKSLLGLFIALGGLLIIFQEHLTNLYKKEFFWGIIWSALACVTWALGTIYTVKHTLKTNVYYNVGWQMLFSGIMLYLISLLPHVFSSMEAYIPKRVPWHTIKTRGWVDLGILVLAGSILCFVCYMYLLKKLPAAQVSIFVYINPIVAMLISSQVFSDEKLTPNLGLGAAITLFGVYLVNANVKLKKQIK
jgi:drug/metabolite transporter (DMT)-like permease